jgi:hypothetical protein
MAKLVTILLGVALLAAGVAAAQGLSSSSDDPQTVSVATSDDGTSTVDGTTTDDGTTTQDGTTTDDNATTTGREPGEDVRGPCDEAEHAGDPRCTGAEAEDGDDNSGLSGHQDDDDHHDDDRSGSNSGRG